LLILQEDAQDEVNLDVYYTNMDKDFSLSYAEVRHEGPPSKAMPEKNTTLFPTTPATSDGLDDPHSYDYPLSNNSGGRLPLIYEEPRTTHANKLNLMMQKKGKLDEAAPQSYEKPLETTFDSSPQKVDEPSLPLDLTRSTRNSKKDMAPQSYSEPLPKKQDGEIYEEPVSSDKVCNSNSHDQVLTPQSYEVPLSKSPVAQNYEEPLSPVETTRSSLRSNSQQEATTPQAYYEPLQIDQEIIPDQTYEYLISPDIKTIHFSESNDQKENLSPQFYEVPITDQNKQLSSHNSNNNLPVGHGKSNQVERVPDFLDPNESLSPQEYEIQHSPQKPNLKSFSKFHDLEKLSPGSSPQDYEGPITGACGQPQDYDEPVSSGPRHSLAPTDEGETPLSYEMPVSIMNNKKVVSHNSTHSVTDKPHW